MSEDTTTAILQRLDELTTRVRALTTLPRLLTITQAAECLGVSTKTVRRHLDRRELRYVQEGAGAAKRIRAADLERWIERNTVREVRP